MTSQEKAKELFEKFKCFAYGGINEKVLDAFHKIGVPDTNRFNELDAFSKIYNAKQCALIAVQEIIEALDAFGYDGAMYDDYETGGTTFTHKQDPCDYWQQVKSEIEKL